MSLTVPPELLARAEAGPVDDEAFLACVAESLPFAWSVLQTVVAGLHASDRPGYALDADPPSDAERGELLRFMASDAMRGAAERRYGVRLAFQNCHKVGAFTPEGAASQGYADFVSPRGQLLNQSPELLNC